MASSNGLPILKEVLYTQHSWYTTLAYAQQFKWCANPRGSALYTTCADAQHLLMHNISNGVPILKEVLYKQHCWYTTLAYAQQFKWCANPKGSALCTTLLMHNISNGLPILKEVLYTQHSWYTTLAYAQQFKWCANPRGSALYTTCADAQHLLMHNSSNGVPIPKEVLYTQHCLYTTLADAQQFKWFVNPKRKCFIYNIVYKQHCLYTTLFMHNGSNGVPILEEVLYTQHCL